MYTTLQLTSYNERMFGINANYPSFKETSDKSKNNRNVICSFVKLRPGEFLRNNRGYIEVLVVELRRSATSSTSDVVAYDSSHRNGTENQVREKSTSIQSHIHGS